MVRKLKDISRSFSEIHTCLAAWFWDTYSLFGGFGGKFFKEIQDRSVFVKSTGISVGDQTTNSAPCITLDKNVCSACIVLGEKQVFSWSTFLFKAPHSYLLGIRILYSEDNLLLAISDRGLYGFRLVIFGKEYLTTERLILESNFHVFEWSPVENYTLCGKSWLRQ